MDRLGHRKDAKKRLPEEDGVDIIGVRGIGFKVYLDIAKARKHPVRVVKDSLSEIFERMDALMDDVEKYLQQLVGIAWIKLLLSCASRSSSRDLQLAN